MPFSFAFTWLHAIKAVRNSSIPPVPAVAGRAPPQAMAPTQVEVTEPIHLLGIFVKIVDMQMSCQGCLCKEHKMCGRVLKEDAVVRLRKIQLMVEGKEEMAAQLFG